MPAMASLSNGSPAMVLDEDTQVIGPDWIHHGCVTFNRGCHQLLLSAPCNLRKDAMSSHAILQISKQLRENEGQDDVSVAVAWFGAPSRHCIYSTARTSGSQREGKRSIYNHSIFGTFDTLFSYVLLAFCKHCQIHVSTLEIVQFQGVEKWSDHLQKYTMCMIEARLRDALRMKWMRKEILTITLFLDPLKNCFVAGIVGYIFRPP